LVSSDPITGVDTYVRVDSDGFWFEKESSNTAEFVDYLHARREETGRIEMGILGAEAAEMPIIFVHKFLRDHGINCMATNDQDQMNSMRRLIDTEYPWMKTENRRLGIK
jgi:hypothetical protein